MNADTKRNLTKLFASGCGTQLGLLMGCGIYVTMLFVAVLCGLASVVSIAVSDVAQQMAELPQPETKVAQVEQAPEQNAQPILANVVVTPAPPPAPVTHLPTTGQVSPPSAPPIVTAEMGRANLRTGPGVNYPRLGVLPENASLPIIGRTADSSWWLVNTIKGLAWVFDGAIAAHNVYDGIPVINFTAPPPTAVPPPAPNPSATPTPPPPAAPPEAGISYPGGTPTAAAIAQRTFVEETKGYKILLKHLAGKPNSKGFAPRGDPILVAEGIELHLVSGDASWSRILLDGNRDYRIFGDAVWSPNGDYIAFVIHYKGERSLDGTIKCGPCRAVALYSMADDTLTILKTHNNLDSEAPRWTQDGRLLVLVHPGEPADGFVYEYNIAGQGRLASGTYLLGTSRDGQQWHPWLPGRVWTVGLSERPDSYYRD